MTENLLPKGSELSGRHWATLLDELPLWSAPFGLALLDKVRHRPGLRVLDLGFGAGFPLLELAQRLGPSARVYGLDPWVPGLIRLREKQAVLRLSNLLAVRGRAEATPFRDGSFDLLVSNNGLNNMADLGRVLAECRPRPGAQLLATMNLPETMTEFYAALEAVLLDMGRRAEAAGIERHIFDKRKPREWLHRLFEDSGFRIAAAEESSFKLRFTDGTAMFRHALIRLAFLEPWEAIVAPEARADVFGRVESQLNAAAAAAGGLSLTVPFVCFDGRRR